MKKLSSKNLMKSIEQTKLKQPGNFDALLRAPQAAGALHQSA
jgi:hypothetical protein